MLVVSRAIGQSLVGHSSMGNWCLTVVDVNFENQSAILNMQTNGMKQRYLLDGIGNDVEIATKARVTLVNVMDSKIRIGIAADVSYQICRSELMESDGSGGLGNSPVPQ